MKKARFLVIAAMLFLGYGITAAGNVAKVGDTEYATFDEALAAWVDGTKLTLLEDVTVNKEIKIGSYNSSTGEITSGGVKEFNLGDNKTIKFDYTGSISYPVLFKILRGTLTLSGTGTVTCGTTGSSKRTTRLVQIFGSPYDNPTEAEYSILNVGKNVTINQPVEYAIEIVGTKLNPSKGKVLDEDNIAGTKANGVIVNIYGKIISHKYCVKTQGYLAATSDNAPVINIYEDAELSDDGTNGKSTAVYASGYAIWNIYGTVTGYTAIYMKAGTVNISNATIAATGTTYHDPVGQGSGITSTSDAITMEANKSYAGQMVLNISGQETSVTSDNGYAIHEAVTTATETGTIELSISDGTFTGASDKGAITYSEELTQALIDGTTSETKWVTNAITGGTFSSNPLITADGYTVTEGTSGGYTVKLEEEVKPGDKVYITLGTEVYNMEVPAGTEIIIQNGVTLTVNNKLTITNDVTKVTVQPGGTLIAGSIESNDPSNLVVEADLENGTGIVKFSGATTTQPQGSVQLALNAYQISEKLHIWQHFGIPTTELPTISKSVAVGYNDWDVKKGWVYTSGSSALTEPFVAHNVTTQATEPGSVLTFKGELVGNADQTLVLDQYGYNGFANSYTAPLSVENLTKALENASTDATVWYYVSGESDFRHYNISEAEEENPAMAAMQGFFVLHEMQGSHKADIDYSEDVYAFEGGNAKDALVYNGGQIKLSDGSVNATLKIKEAEGFSDDFDLGYDSYQMPTDNIQIYAKIGESNYASYATNDLNNKIIEIITKENTEYTLTFSNLKNDAFALFDITDPTNEKEVTITEGGTYTFTAPANQTVQYFRLGEGHLTGAEEAEATELNFWTNDNTLYVAGADADIVVYNAAGVKVAAVKANGAAIQTVNIAGLAGGLYIVESGALTGKFIK